MVQIKFLFAILAVMTIVILTANTAESKDCLSGAFKGPCFAWSRERCRRICMESGRPSGHCSSSMKCWCEQC
ncbi:drosomycin-like [Drosophila gunungcola]|uniref:drosomycin-like n=1 Tax=Drosophila elegans TaxID=30023 RepID=UPI0007E5DCAD|nr:drosomycin-like [Drosophila elegans]XP_052847817.1 drosomycin-like [Drosophila gunungcola]